MKNLKIIGESNSPIAIIIESEYSCSKGIDFFTSSDSFFQVAAIKNLAGHEVERHFHPPIERLIKQTTECLLIKKGSILMSFYNVNLDHIGEFELMKGDIIIIFCGGHSIKYLEDSEIVEIRQGPYSKVLDKIKF